MDWLTKVKSARAAGSFEKAMEVLLQELAIRPKDPEIYYQIAWTHDALGKERDAFPAYEKAIELGLAGEDLRGAYLGLGSTYRTIGLYEKSKIVLERGIVLFPQYRPLQVFLSLTLFNLGEKNRTVEILLQQLLETSSDEAIKEYQRALLFYSDKLDEVFE